MVCTPCCLACCSIAAPEALSRLTIASTVTPLVIICWAIVCICCASPPAFWMSKSTPAALNADSSCGRSALSQRGDDVVSGRMTPTLPWLEALPLPLLPPLPPLSSLPQAARPTTRPAARTVVIRVRRRAMDLCPFLRWNNVVSSGTCFARPHVTASTRPDRCTTVTWDEAPTGPSAAVRLPAGNFDVPSPGGPSQCVTQCGGPVSSGERRPRALREVVFVDGVRTPFGKAGPTGIYAETRADDLVLTCFRDLLRRNPALPAERVDEVAIAATTQIGDQGLTIGRTAALLAGLPKSVPGYAIDRMCAGALTAVTPTASGIAFGAYDVAIAGGVEHMGHHPMGEGVDPNPRIVSEKLVDPSALVMGQTAENLHDRFPEITKERADAFAVASQAKLEAAYEQGRIQRDLVPVAVRSAEQGWGLATRDDPPRPGTTIGDLATLKTPFRPHGRVTAGNAAGLNDGATACILASADTAEELGLPAPMRLVNLPFAGVDPEVMGVGPVPATEKLLARTGISVDEIGLFEINEAFAVQVLAFLEHFGIKDDDERVNPDGGAIALGHPLASSGVRLMTQLARHFEEHPEVRYGLTTMCIGIGMGGSVLWENPRHQDYGKESAA